MSKESDNNKQLLVDQLAQTELELTGIEEALDRVRVRKLKLLGAIEYHDHLFVENRAEGSGSGGTVAAVEEATEKPQQKAEKKKENKKDES